MEKCAYKAVCVTYLHRQGYSTSGCRHHYCDLGFENAKCKSEGLFMSPKLRIVFGPIVGDSIPMAGARSTLVARESINWVSQDAWCTPRIDSRLFMKRAIGRRHFANRAYPPAVPGTSNYTAHESMLQCPYDRVIAGSSLRVCSILKLLLIRAFCSAVFAMSDESRSLLSAAELPTCRVPVRSPMQRPSEGLEPPSCNPCGRLWASELCWKISRH